MEEQSGEKPELIAKIAKYLPSVQKPLYKQGFNERLKWTGIALLLYLVMSYITVYGLAPTSYEQFRFFEIVLGSRFGSIMTLGIGPIVTAGIILQLLVGSKIINWDMSKPESKKRFQSWNKVLAIAFSFIEATAYVLAGAVPVAGDFTIFLMVILQLAAGGVLVILLDEIVSKWGFGSGVSLFIAAGVGSQILVRAFSPLTATCAVLQFGTCFPSEGSPPTGLFWNSLLNLLGGKFIEATVNFIPLLATVLIFFLVIYIQAIKVEVPLAFSALRGFGRSWALKLLYTSNIPVILTAALLANVQLMGRVGVAPTPEGLNCGFMGCFDKQGTPINGLVYFLSAPRNLLIDFVTSALTPKEVFRALTYTAFLVIGAVIFSVFWVNTAGMDAKSIAEQIEGVGMQIPGYRRDPRIVESVLNRYIPPLSVLGGLTVGLLAALGDSLGTIGTGTGILLTVMIVYNYYEELSNQPLEDAHPFIRKLLGGE